jgi:hypothetical protein
MAVTADSGEKSGQPGGVIWRGEKGGNGEEDAGSYRHGAEKKRAGSKEDLGGE